MKQLALQFDICDGEGLLSEPNFGGERTPPGECLVYPPARSVYGRVLGMLLEGQHLTHKDAQAKLSASRLAAAVHRLRSMGWPVEKMIIRVLTRDHGRVSYVARYWINPTEIAKASAVGHLYVLACKRAFHGAKAA